MEGGDLRVSSIDQRVVQMSFDNRQFEQGVATTMGSLDKLNKSLQLQGATKGLSDVNEAAKGISLGNLASGVSDIADRFKTMSVIGITALTNITNKVVDAGIELAKSFTIDPVRDGFQNYETQINAVQTILANTAAAGTKLEDVNKVLAELNTYANQTVYNFSDMTKNIGTFTAAGVGLQTSVDSIKGIANLAAMSGATSEQASSAMYQLSQAIAAGSVKLQDWNSVVNAGLGGKTFQTALENTARASGVAIDKIIKKQGSFRESLQTGWLTSDILTKTLTQFTGDLSLAQIKAMGYTDKQAQDILALGKTAVDSATKIKTMTQLSQALKEEVATAYAAIFKTIFGGIGEATDLFSNIHNAAENALTNPIYALNTLLEGWDKLGGRKALIDGLTNAIHAFSSVITPLKDAFREVFPATTAKQLYDMTVSFRDFMERLKIGGTTAKELKSTFAGLFAILGIGWDVIKAVAKTILDLVDSATKGSGGILKFTASIGDWLVHLKTAIEKGDDLTKFFGKLERVLEVPIKLLRDLGGYIEKLFDKFDGSKVEKSLTAVGAKLTPFAELGKLADKAWTALFDHLGAIGKFFEPLAKKFEGFFKAVGDGVKTVINGIANLNFSDVLHTIDAGLFAGLVLLIKKLVDKFKGKDDNPLGGFVDTIKETFESLTKTFETMQKTLKATTLLEIALAIGALTISVSILSKVDSAGLLRASAAITAMFVQLMGALTIFDKFIKGDGWAKMPILMGSLILLAIAVDVLVVAVKKLAELSWTELSKGLTGLTVILAELSASIKLMGNPEHVASMGLAMLALSEGVYVLTKAVAALAQLSWTELAKGLIGVGTLLVGLALFTKFADAGKAGILQGAGIILLAEGIKILADALKIFASFSWGEIGKGLATLAGALLAIGAALYLIPPTSVLSAAAVLIVAASLGLIGDALKKMGSMSWGSIGKSLTELAGALTLIAAALFILPPTSLLSAAAIFVVAASLGMIVDALGKMGGMSWTAIAKSLVELAGSLTIIAAAMYVMEAALPGAAALVVVAAALMLLAPVLKAFGGMSWVEIAKSLVMLAGVFVVLGLAGLALGALTPVLLALGAAILLLGLGVLAAGAGVFLFAAALTALSLAGAAGATALVAIVTAMLGLLPEVAKQIGLAVISFADTIAKAGPAVLKALVTVLSAMIDAIVQLAPKIVDALLKLLGMLLDALNKYVPHLIDAGAHLVVAILNGIASHLGEVITSATNVIIAFLNGISQNIPRVIQSGVDLVVNFINSLANAIRSNSHQVGEAGGNLAAAMIEGMVSGLGAGVGKVVSAAENIAGSAINAAKKVLDINSPSKEFIKIGQSVNEGFAKGLQSGNAATVDQAFQGLRDQLQTTIDASSQSIDALEAKLRKLTSARHKDRAAIAQTRQDLAQAISEKQKESAAYDQVTNALWGEHVALDALANQYDNVKNKIVEANKALADAIKIRDAYNDQVTKQFGATAKITKDQTVASYEGDLQKQIEKTKEFANVLQRLHKLGLSDAEYMDLLSQGTDVLPFAQQLLQEGKSGVDHLNDLTGQLSTASKQFGTTASTDLYQAAVDSAAGLVKGLEQQKAAIEQQMEWIAEAMVNAIKQKLGIQSPSKVFAEIGGWSAQGLAKGLIAASSVVEDSAAAVGQKAITSLSKSLSGMSNLVMSNIDVNPTITPVLDLSGVKKDAGQIGSLLGSQSISVQSAYSKAVSASAGYMSNMSAVAQPNAQPQAPTVTFTQYNSSPAALSTADIYRQTKNQLSQVRGALVYQGGNP